MSLTPSPRLSLKRNDGADPFLRQDFIDNWDKIDLAPGVHICTSGSRPTWGADEAGRQIWETDMRRNVGWTGSTWIEELSVAAAWTRSLSVNATVSNNTTANYTVGTITSTCPGNILIHCNVRLGCTPSSTQSAYALVLVDGVDRSVGGLGASFTQWLDTNAVYPSADHRTIPIIATANIASGTHTIVASVHVNNLSGIDCFVGNIALDAMMVNSVTT